MSFFEKRFAEYIREMERLQASVSDPVFFDSFEQKLFDLLARQVITGEDIEPILNEIDRIFQTEFEPFAEGIRDGYNDLLLEVNKRYGDFGPDMSREFQQLRRIEIVNDLELGDYTESTTQAIKEKVAEGIREGKSMTELQADIAGIDSRAKFYAETLARTHLMRYGRVSKYEKAIASNVTIFAYLGVRRDTIRPFCDILLGHRYHIDDIHRMKNGNLEPVVYNCGGWNCIHDWEPDPFFPEEDVVSGDLEDLAGAPGALIIFPEAD